MKVDAVTAVVNGSILTRENKLCLFLQYVWKIDRKVGNELF